MANEERSAEMAITSLISNKRESNNFFIKFLKLQKFEVKFEIPAAKTKGKSFPAKAFLA